MRKTTFIILFKCRKFKERWKKVKNQAAFPASCKENVKCKEHRASRVFTGSHYFMVYAGYFEIVSYNWLLYMPHAVDRTLLITQVVSILITNNYGYVVLCSRWGEDVRVDPMNGAELWQRYCLEIISERWIWKKGAIKSYRLKVMFIVREISPFGQYSFQNSPLKICRINVTRFVFVCFFNERCNDLRFIYYKPRELLLNKARFANAYAYIHNSMTEVIIYFLILNFY